MTAQDNMSFIFSQLSKDSQRYLLNMANMAKVAETGKEKEIYPEKKSRNQPQRKTG